MTVRAFVPNTAVVYVYRPDALTLKRVVALALSAYHLLITNPIAITIKKEITKFDIIIPMIS